MFVVVTCEIFVRMMILEMDRITAKGEVLDKVLYVYFMYSLILAHLCFWSKVNLTVYNNVMCNFTFI
ncbi:unnamed protein product [Arabidopsis halleri]